MRPDRTTTAPLRLARGLALAASCALGLAPPAAAGGGRARPRPTVDRESYEARALFVKLWEPGVADRGDGVGPLYNERSCVGCHHQGGAGGAGDNDRNVTLLVAHPAERIGASMGTGPGPFVGIFDGNLVDLHPEFRFGASVVLHKHATDDRDEARLARIATHHAVAGRAGAFSLSRSERSTPALFGAGRLDALPDAVLVAAAARAFPDFPEVRGRVSRLPDGRLGKFGWKGQTAGLGEFVRAACASELGLEVPGQHRPTFAATPDAPDPAPALDLDARDLARLTRFVAELPAPAVRPADGADWGAAVFEGVGCATCHAPSLGGVDGLYSDLLLHDLGSAMQGTGGGYGSPAPSPTSPGDLAAREPDAPTPLGPARPSEWRTPPLWGVADSAPYLHDGRAPTLHRAILLHGGEAGPTTRRYRDLLPADRLALLAFLRSQVAPASPDRPAEKHAARGRRG